MKAAVYYGPHDIRCADVPDAKITRPDEILVEIEATSICGSDLHLYRGALDFLMERGHSTTGHELVGRVVDVGPDVRLFKRGDRVTTPFNVSCGHCFMCEVGQTGHCETTHGAIIGFGKLLGDHGGTQAQAIVVPHADADSMIVPADLAPEAVLTLSCNLPAAIVGVEAADIRFGETVAIVGCGPSGLMTLDYALHRGAEKIVVFDRVAHRLAVAKRKGAVTINIDEEGWKELAMAETHGRGFDKVIEVVGQPEALNISIALVRAGGTISSIGVFSATNFPLDVMNFTSRNVTLKMNATANVRPYLRQALHSLIEGIVDPSEYFTHPFALSDVDKAYKTFEAASDGVVKVLIRP